MTVKLGVLISGSGTNLQAIIDRIADGSLDASIEIVIASRESAYGLKRAAQADIPTMSLTPDLYRADPIAADEVIATALLDHGVDYVIMAGYMRMVREPLLEAFPNRIVNLHPALLPAFKGAHAIQDAYERGVKVTGATVHYVNAIPDGGQILLQKAVDVHEGDTPEALQRRVMEEAEWILLPRACEMVAERICGERK